MKLNDAEKKTRKMYRTKLETMGGWMQSDRVLGTTIAAVPALAFDDNYGAGGMDVMNKFFYVSASHCNHAADKFNRKRGELLALERLFDGEFIMVPSGDREVREIV